MNAEIIAVGSEMLTPTRLDTNSLFLTGKLAELGIDVVRKVVVGDDLARLTEEARRALAASEIVIMTGGLGPTLDDLSRDAASAATGRALALDPAIVDFVSVKEGLSLPQVDSLLNKQSGLLGLSGLTPDMRELLAESAEHNDRRARLASQDDATGAQAPADEQHYQANDEQHPQQRAAAAS